VAVSVLGFGCMRLPVLDGAMKRIDEEAAQALLHQAIASGVNYLDTAYPYHGGESEPFVGRALRGGYRDQVHLATKSPTWLVHQERDWERLLDEQLKRLETDSIDFYLLHALSAERWATVRRTGGLQAMERALADGRIKHLGFSFHDSLKVFREILEAYDWTFCQIQYNFIDEDYQAGTEGLRLAAARGTGVIAMEPLRGGTLAMAQPEAIQRLWARSPEPREPAAWALRWVWDHPEVVTALSGMNTPGQVGANVAAASEACAGSLTPPELALVEEVRATYASRALVPCTTCGYCAPCPSGVAIPETFATYNTGAMFSQWQGAASSYAMFLTGAGHDAGRCSSCGACETQCPQQIPIMEKLREAHRALTS
jgi:predicted aldo/keto reductase-like oxidoreductase